MKRTAATAGFLALLAGGLPAWGQQWVGERLCADGLLQDGEFGSAIAIGGDGTIAVGDYRHDRVYRFGRDEAGRCRQLATIQGDPGSWFGFSLATDATGGNRLLIGAPQAGDGTGAAYLYDLATGVRLQELSVPQAQGGDEVGSSVAMDGGFLAIGARGANGRSGNDRSGRVYAGTKDNLMVVPTPDGLAPRAELGQSVALSGRTLVMGAPSPFHGSNSPGAAYVVTLSPADGSPGTPAPLRSADSLEPEAAFGYAVAVDRGRILVGAPWPGGAGAVYDFRREPGSAEWGRGTRLPGLPSSPGDQLGVAVALNGGIAIIGARYTDGTRGAAYRVGVSGDSQSLRPPEPIPAEAQFGFSVAIRGGIAVVGAFREEAKGAAYLFQHQFVPAVQIDMAGEVEETDTVLPVILRTSDGNPVPRDFTFRIHTIPRTAEEKPAPESAGDYDYLRLDRQVVLPAGEAMTSVEISLYRDDICEERETFQVVLDLEDSIQTVDVTIDEDDDSAGGIELTPTQLQTSENGTRQTLSVRLTCPPVAKVDVLLSTSDSTEGAVSPDELTFTPDNWDDDQLVEVVGQDDALCDDDQPYSVNARARSQDTRYAGLTDSTSGYVNTDDERACFSVDDDDTSACADGGGTIVYTASFINSSLRGAPDAPAELLDGLPSDVSVVTASADRGTATADPIGNSVRWTGLVPVGEQVTVTIVAAFDGPPDPELASHQAELTYDGDGRGDRETIPIVFSAAEVVSCDP